MEPTVDPLVVPSSLQSRIELLTDKVWNQIGVNPLFGDLAADRLTGDPGTYLHSLISVQTHLGLVGSLLLFSSLFAMMFRLYTRPASRSLRVVAPVVLGAAVLTTFWTWMPFWMVVGALWGQALRRG